MMQMAYNMYFIQSINTCLLKNNLQPLYEKDISWSVKTGKREFQES
jgi:hypothetical protein